MAFTIRCEEVSYVLADRITVCISLFYLPEDYSTTQCGIQITEEQLDEVTEQCDIFPDNKDYFTEPFRQECERLIPNNVEADIYLKYNLDVNRLPSLNQTISWYRLIISVISQENSDLYLSREV